MCARVLVQLSSHIEASHDQELQAAKIDGLDGGKGDQADLELLREENARLKRQNETLEVKVSSLLRDNKDMNDAVLQLTNDRDALRLQLERYEPDAPSAESNEGNGNLGVLAGKNEEIAKMRAKIQELQMMADIANDSQAQKASTMPVRAIAAQVEREEKEVKQAEKKFASRQEGLELEIRNIDNKFAMKEKMAEQLAKQGLQFEKMKSQYEKNIGHLESEISKKHLERDEHLKKLSSVKQLSQAEALQIRQRYEDKISSLRKQLVGMKAKQKDAAQNLALQRSQAAKLKTVQTEMEGLKREKIQLRKRMKEEAVAHREWKNERELELRQMRRKHQKTQYELTKLENKSERTENVLRRKNEEVASVHRRLKEMERNHSGRSGGQGKGRLLPGDVSSLNTEVISMWLDEQISECTKETQLKHKLSNAIKRRRQLAHRNSAEEDPAELETLKEEIKFRTAEIQDLQQKIGFGGNVSSRLLTRVKRAANVEELRLVLMAGIEQQVQLRSEQAELERNVTVAEEATATAEKNVTLAKQGFERKSLEAQQEYEENMAGLLQTIAKQDEIILGQSETLPADGHGDEEYTKLRCALTCYKSVSC
eukprot:SAG31_NODE_728_length_12522_cov_13.320534_2_plen_597_part_00